MPVVSRPESHDVPEEQKPQDKLGSEIGADWTETFLDSQHREDTGRRR